MLEVTNKKERKNKYLTLPNVITSINSIESLNSIESIVSLDESIGENKSLIKMPSSELRRKKLKPAIKSLKSSETL